MALDKTSATNEDPDPHDETRIVLNGLVEFDAEDNFSSSN